MDYYEDLLFTDVAACSRKMTELNKLGLIGPKFNSPATSLVGDFIRNREAFPLPRNKIDPPRAIYWYPNEKIVKIQNNFKQ